MFHFISQYMKIAFKSYIRKYTITSLTPAEPHVEAPVCKINSPGALKCTYVKAGDISAAAKIRNWSQRSLFDSSISLRVFRDVTLKHS